MPGWLPFLFPAVCWRCPAKVNRTGEALFKHDPTTVWFNLPLHAICKRDRSNIIRNKLPRHSTTRETIVGTFLLSSANDRPPSFPTIICQERARFCANDNESGTYSPSSRVFSTLRKRDVTFRRRQRGT